MTTSGNVRPADMVRITTPALAENQYIDNNVLVFELGDNNRDFYNSDGFQ